MSLSASWKKLYQMCSPSKTKLWSTKNLQNEKLVCLQWHHDWLRTVFDLRSRTWGMNAVTQWWLDLTSASQCSAWLYDVCMCSRYMCVVCPSVFWYFILHSGRVTWARTQGYLYWPWTPDRSHFSPRGGVRLKNECEGKPEFTVSAVMTAWRAAVAMKCCWWQGVITSFSVKVGWYRPDSTGSGSDKQWTHHSHMSIIWVIRWCILKGVERASL